MKLSNNCFDIVSSDWVKSVKSIDVTKLGKAITYDVLFAFTLNDTPLYVHLTIAFNTLSAALVLLFKLFFSIKSKLF